MTTGSKLAEKLARVSLACRHIEKDGTNAFHKYQFTSAAAVNARVNTHLGAEGLAIVDTDPSIISDVGTGKDRVVTVKVVIVVCDCESGERATFRGIGSGQDAGDKAVMKAETAAAKYAWLLGLCIAMGDDPEADEETDRRAAAPAQRRPASRPESASTPAQPRRQDNRSQAMERARDAVAHVGGDNPTLGEFNVALGAAADPPPELDGFLARVGEIELPGEAVAVWMKHRDEVAKLPPKAREYAWVSLRARTEQVGKMKNAHHWLRKAVEEEDARRAVQQKAAAQ